VEGAGDEGTFGGFTPPPPPRENSTLPSQLDSRRLTRVREVVGHDSGGGGR
jgi:hypothetical protein